MKKIICPECNTEYRLPDDKVAGKPIKTRCKKCGAIIRINNPSPENKDSNTPPSPPHQKDNKEEPSKYRDVPILERRGDTRPFDALSLAVFIIGILALIFVGYMGYRSISKGMRIVSIKELSQKIIDTYLKEMPTGRVKRRYKSPEEERYFSYINRGHRFYRDKQYDKAVKFYNLAIKYKPERYEAYYWRGQLLATKGENKRAVEDMMQVIRLNPKNVSAFNYLGWIYSNEKKWNKAIEYLSKAIELNPKNAWAYYNRGRCYYKLGQREKALQDAKRSCELGYKKGCEIYKRLRKG